jgi:uncharacterized membrane protein
MIAAVLYDWLLFLHIVAAMVWVGGLVALTAFGAHARRSRQREAVARFVGSLRVVGPFVLGPASALVIAFGIWLVIDSSAWDFGQSWGVRLILLLLVVATWDMVFKPGL